MIDAMRDNIFHRKLSDDEHAAMTQDSSSSRINGNGPEHIVTSTTAGNIQCKNSVADYQKVLYFQGAG